jgi:hypothetical protein
MKDIHEVLRRKQAQYAQLSKQIEALQAAADKLQEVAPLLEEEDGSALVLEEVSDEPRSMSAKAAPAAAPAAKAPARNTTPRWP